MLQEYKVFLTCLALSSIDVCCANFTLSENIHLSSPNDRLKELISVPYDANRKKKAGIQSCEWLYGDFGTLSYYGQMISWSHDLGSRHTCEEPGASCSTTAVLRSSISISPDDARRGVHPPSLFRLHANNDSSL